VHKTNVNHLNCKLYNQLSGETSPLCCIESQNMWLNIVKHNLFNGFITKMFLHSFSQREAT